MERRFLRKSNDRVIGGVCAGLADYFDVSRSLVRLLALIGIMASAVIPGLFLYFLCVIIVPYDTQAKGGSSYTDNSYQTSYTESNNYTEDRGYDSNRGSGNSRLVIGVLLIAAGIFFFARMFFGWLDWRYIFAGLLIIGGAYMIFGNKRDS